MAATTPEMPNEQPELQKGSPEAQAVNNLQQDTLFNPVNAGDLDNAFANKGDDVSNIFGDVKISDKASTPFGDQAETKDLASMTTQELETAIKEQRAYVNGIENQIASVSSASDAAGIKQQADKLAEADAYFANV